jgi:hypothetical protein
VSDNGLDDRAIGVRSPAGANDFSSSLCPDQLWGPRSILSNVYRCFFPRGLTLISHPHLVPRSRLSRSYISSPPPQALPWRVVGQLFFLYWRKLHIQIRVKRYLYTYKALVLQSGQQCAVRALKLEEYKITVLVL